jgi:hypothetical protein
MGCLHGGGHSHGGFADDLDELQQREEEQAIGIEVGTHVPMGDGDSFIDVVDHLAECDTVVMPRHRLPALP